MFPTLSPIVPCILAICLLILSIISPYDPGHFFCILALCPAGVGIKKIVELNSDSNAKPLPIQHNDSNPGRSHSPSVFLELISIVHRSYI